MFALCRPLLPVSCRRLSHSHLSLYNVPLMQRHKPAFFFSTQARGKEHSRGPCLCLLSLSLSSVCTRFEHKPPRALSFGASWPVFLSTAAAAPALVFKSQEKNSIPLQRTIVSVSHTPPPPPTPHYNDTPTTSPAPAPRRRLAWCVHNGTFSLSVIIFLYSPIPNSKAPPHARPISHQPLLLMTRRRTDEQWQL